MTKSVQVTLHDGEIFRDSVVNLPRFTLKFIPTVNPQTAVITD